MPEGRGLPAELPAQSRASSPLGTRLGLRTQLLLALAVLFVLSFSLLATAAVQLSRRSAMLEQRRHAEQIAALLAQHIDSTVGLDRDARVRAFLTAAHQNLSLSALRWTPAAAAPLELGDVPAGAGVQVGLRSGGLLEVSWRGREANSAAALRQLLIFYVALTAGAVLLFAFVLLTFLIVRPLSAVTRSAERLSEGDLSVRVPVAGAAEVVRLATSFNRMASQLRAEREGLQAQVTELLRTTEALTATQAQLVHGEKLASVGRLSAGIAHEIGNPLSAILGMVELLQGEGLSAAQRSEFLERIHTQTERINGIIRSLLDFARREPVTATELEAVDLSAVVQDALSLLQPQRAARGVSLAGELPDGLPAVVGTHAQLTQVLLNLLLNALDALAGQGSVTVGAQQVSSDAVELWVEDDGPGVAPEVVEHLFEPFTTTKPVGQGTGLGLAVAQGIVERLGGQLSLDARAGGARFVVRLRRAKSKTSRDSRSTDAERQ